MSNYFLRIIRKFCFGFVALMPDLFPFTQFRVFVYRVWGNRIGKKVRIFGGCDVLGNQMYLGDNVFINRRCYFDLTEPIRIESEVTIGHGVTFITASHQIGASNHRAGNVLGKPISIGAGTWIGANVTILPGVSIGPGCIVAACSVLTSDFDADSLIVGSPAIKKRSLS